MNDSLINAISWTLVHSIWQGFILAFLAGMVILLNKKASSVVRYNLLLALFLCFIVSIALTFSYEFQNYSEISVKSLNFSVDQLNVIWTVENGTVFNHFSIVIIDFFNRNANVIVLIWLIVFCVKSFEITNNLRNIYIIRNYRNQVVSDYWKEKVEILSKKINLHKSIVLLESHLVKVPSVTGFLKPIILLPIGLISHLHHDEIEAILLHELAHIKRKDYVVNLIQSFAEIAFFFNPGVLWLCSLIREERENCCDDMAVSITQCKTKFVHALISFQEYKSKDNELVMGFGGKKNHLLNRAKRIIMNDAKSLNNIEKTLLSVAVFAVVIAMFAFGNTTIPDSKKEAISIDQKTNSKGLIDVCFTTPVQPMTEAEALAEEGRKKADERAIEVENPYLKYDLFPESEAEVINSKTKTTTNFEMKTVTTVDCKPTMTETISISSDKILESPDRMTTSIINDLTLSKIISGKKNLSYSLSKTKLVVNGVIQSDLIHAKFKQKYLNPVQQKHDISDNISINYNYEISNLMASN